MNAAPRRALAGLRRALAASLLAAAPASAAVFTVTANPDMTFTPAEITLYQGDAIVFVNGGGVHNVRADNDSFRCALNCSNHGEPSAEPWRATVQFRHLGTLGYYCEAHGDLAGGMRGRITVLDRVFVDGFDPPAPPR